MYQYCLFIYVNIIQLADLFICTFVSYLLSFPSIIFLLDVCTESTHVVQNDIQNYMHVYSFTYVHIYIYIYILYIYIYTYI